MLRALVQMRYWLAAALLVSGSASLGFADVIYVRSDASGANNGTNWNDVYVDLQIALSVSQAGDEIRVGQGTYKPAPPGVGNRGISFAMGSGVTILGGFAGNGPNPDARDVALYATILSGDINNNPAQDSYHVVRAEGVDDAAVLDGFTITRGRADQPAPNEAGAGIYMVNSSAQVRACAITGNIAGYLVSFPVADHFGRGGGLYVEGGAPLFADCLIQQNTSRRYGGGAYLHSSNAVFDNCRISDNFSEDSPTVLSTDGGGGVYSDQGAPVFRDCEIESNETRASGAGYSPGRARRRLSVASFRRISASLELAGGS